MSDFRVVEIKTEANLYQTTHEVEYSSSRCGEIYVGDNAKKWTFICTLCDKSFHEIDEFMSHIKVSHVNIPPPPSAEPRASSHDMSMQQDCFKCEGEGPLFNSLDNALIDEFVNYNDFLDADRQDVPDDILSETNRKIEVPVNQDVKPDTHVRCKRGSNSEVVKATRSSSSDVKPDTHVRCKRGSNSEPVKAIRSSSSDLTPHPHVRCKRGSNSEIVKATRSSSSSAESYQSCPSEKRTKKIQARKVQDRKRRFCHICKRKFKYPSLYRNHMVKHTTDRPFQCAICKKDFKSKQSIRYHLKTHQREQYKCEICSLQFCIEARFVSHMETHKSKNSHPCEVCGKLNRSNADKMIHMRTHTGDHPFACKYCSKRFRMRRHLGNHLKLHFTYRCERCRKQFQNGVPMIKPYTCPDCYGQTDRENDEDEDDDSEVSDDEEKDVTFHPVTYSERAILEPISSRYICKHCKRTYASKRALSKHISLKH